MSSRASKVLGWLRGAGRTEPEAPAAESITFSCNVCGTGNEVPRSAFSREVPSCSRCDSTVRMRSIIHVLSMELFGECLAIDDFPAAAGQLKGVGMSDWADYAKRLAVRCDYQNTYYHQQPRLDICAPDPSLLGTLDFIISTDVYEHVVPPVQVAFDNAYRLLKPGGVFVMSVPYKLDGVTEEHFPELHEFRVEQQGDNYILHNQTADGRSQEFRDLVFHGGPGQTLEMRVFALPSLRENLAAAGFEQVEIHEQDALECGMVWEFGWGLTMAARKAQAPLENDIPE